MNQQDHHHERLECLANVRPVTETGVQPIRQIQAHDQHRHVGGRENAVGDGRVGIENGDRDEHQDHVYGDEEGQHLEETGG